MRALVIALLGMSLAGSAAAQSGFPRQTPDQFGQPQYRPQGGSGAQVGPGQSQPDAYSYGRLNTRPPSNAGQPQYGQQGGSGGQVGPGQSPPDPYSYGRLNTQQPSPPGQYPTRPHDYQPGSQPQPGLGGGQSEPYGARQAQGQGRYQRGQGGRDERGYPPSAGSPGYLPPPPTFPPLFPPRPGSAPSPY